MNSKLKRNVRSKGLCRDIFFFQPLIRGKKNSLYVIGLQTPNFLSIWNKFTHKREIAYRL